MPPSDPASSARRLYEDQVAGHLLALREALVRHDENLAAYRLLTECVPYYLHGHLGVERAREEQRLMVEHLLDPEVYAAYYAANPYERPFEEQFGGQLSVENANRIPRVRWVNDKLFKQRWTDHEHGTPDPPLWLLDLGCNDGWMGAHLLHGNCVSQVVGVDLAPDCVIRANKRDARITAHVGRVEDAPYIARDPLKRHGLLDAYGAVTCFEVLEHVLDPVAVIQAAAACCKPGGRVYLSTPHGATEQGDLPGWAFVEHKGHVRAWLPDDFTDAVKQAGLVPVELVVDPDGLMLMEAKHA